MIPKLKNLGANLLHFIVSRVQRLILLLTLLLILANIIGYVYFMYSAKAIYAVISLGAIVVFTHLNKQF